MRILRLYWCAGIKLDNECNIVSVEPRSAAARAGLPPPGKWAVTEINNRPLNLLKVPKYTVLHHTALCCIVLHHTALCCTILHRAASYCTVLHHTALCCIILHCAASYCTVLHRAATHLGAKYHYATSSNLLTATSFIVDTILCAQPLYNHRLQVLPEQRTFLCLL
jgi:hypothetical protein